jgi:hypothetical protein
MAEKDMLDKIQNESARIVSGEQGPPWPSG